MLDRAGRLKQVICLIYKGGDSGEMFVATGSVPDHRIHGSPKSVSESITFAAQKSGAVDAVESHTRYSWQRTAETHGPAACSCGKALLDGLQEITPIVFAGRLVLARFSGCHILGELFVKSGQRDAKMLFKSRLPSKFGDLG